MTYAPINTNAYTAAYSGAIAGMAVGGWITSASLANYALVTAIAGAYAQEFDIVWNNADAIDDLESKCITTVSQNQFMMRQPGALENDTFIDPDTWEVPARACAALVLECEAYFATQSITPPSMPGFEVTTVLYVNPNSSITPGNGSVSAPFVDLQDALDVVSDAPTTLNAFGFPETLYQINMAPGAYVGPYTCSVENKTLVISIGEIGSMELGDGGATPSFAFTDCTDQTRVTLENIYGNAVAISTDESATGATVITLRNCHILVSITSAGPLWLVMSGINAPRAISQVGGVDISSFAGSITLSNADSTVLLTNTQISTSVACGVLVTQDCVLPGSGTAVTCHGNAMFSKGTQFGNVGSSGNITLQFDGVGSWYVDAFTNYNIKAKTETLTNITKVVAADTAA